jgi:uncharacterized membrane protein YcaP (DUF421 family)
MVTIICRAIIIYVVVLFVFRVMGKRQIGQMQPFELVLTLVIADLATIPMAEVSVPVLHGIVPLLTLVLIHFAISLISKISPRVARFISGKPVIVINPKGIDYKAMKELDVSVDDLFEGIRGQGYFSLEHIQYAIMETTGKLSVMPKGDFSPVTNLDLKNEVDDSFLPITLVREGQIVKDNLQVAKVDEEVVKKYLQKKEGKGVKIKDVLIFTVDKSGNVYLQMKEKECQLYRGGVK